MENIENARTYRICFAYLLKTHSSGSGLRKTPWLNSTWTVLCLVQGSWCGRVPSPKFKFKGVLGVVPAPQPSRVKGRNAAAEGSGRSAVSLRSRGWKNKKSHELVVCYVSLCWEHRVDYFSGTFFYLANGNAAREITSNQWACTPSTTDCACIPESTGRACVPVRT